MAATQKKAEAKEPKAPAEDKPKAKRTVLSPEDKIAKLEADLAAARQKAQDKRDKVVSDKREERAKLQAKADELRLKISEIDAELERLVNPTVTPLEVDEPDAGA
jgi:multidrug efflux pump subunit AcrA (membrane-fusion protein)